MMAPQERRQVPLVHGWFTLDAHEPRLLGNRCRACGDAFFPRAGACRNPDCGGGELEEVGLSPRGRLWSWTINHYQPPPPYVPPEPFAPYAVAVVELLDHGLMVLGQVARGCDPGALRVGMEMELVVEPLHTDPAGAEVIVWKWRPAGAGPRTIGEGG